MCGVTRSPDPRNVSVSLLDREGRGRDEGRAIDAQVDRLDV